MVKTLIALRHMSVKEFVVAFDHETKWFHPHRTPSRRRHHRDPGCRGCGGV